MNSAEFITPGVAEHALHLLHSARTDAQCRHALVAAAELIQRAAAAGQPEVDFNKVMDPLGERFPIEYENIMDRAVTHRMLPDGSSLMFWVLPIVLAEPELPHAIPLKLDPVTGNLLGNLAYRAMGLPMPEPGKPRCELFLMPTLLSADSFLATDAVELINFLPNTWASRQGRESLRFAYTAPDEAPDAPVAYYMPAVVHIPAGMALKKAEPLSELSTALQDFLCQGLGLAPELITASPLPVPFDDSAEMAYRMKLDVSIQWFVSNACHEYSIAPQAIKALVSVYHSSNRPDSLIGITLSDRLSDSTLCAFNLPLLTDDGFQELGQVTHALRGYGVGKVTPNTVPVSTLHCQHCGRMQYCVPPADPEVTPPSSTVN